MAGVYANDGSYNVTLVAGTLSNSASVAKAEDSVHASGDPGVFILGVRQDGVGPLAGTSGDYIPLSTDAYGSLKAVLYSNANGTPLDFSGATTVNRLLSAAASTNGTNVKASAGKIYTISGKNAAAAIRYLKLYNTAGVPTVGTDTPVATLEIAASVAFIFDFPAGWYFNTGIGFGWTTAQADNSTAALTAADITSQNIWYA